MVSLFKLTLCQGFFFFFVFVLHSYDRTHKYSFFQYFDSECVQKRRDNNRQKDKEFHIKTIV